jgi:multidrug efflux system membrane fusion protein
MDPERREPERPVLMNLRRILPILVGAAVVIAVGAYVMLGEQQKQEQKSRRSRQSFGDTAPVLVANAKTADVPVYLDAVGTIKALNTVTVTAQVTGQITKIGFREGQDVTAGFVLAEIDPRTYQAQYDQSLAKKAQDEATLANARIDLERYNKLVAANSGSKQQADTQKALVAQLEAQLQADQAAIDNAKTMLSYTKITAPISGRTGIRLVDEGNVVQSSNTTGIVVITQIKPISVLFNLPQQQFPQVSKAFAAAGGTLPVDAVSGDNHTTLDHGELKVIDNQMDQTTGTIRMKAEFPNADLSLWPGQFVNVRVLVETLKQVVVVPTAAVQRGPNGSFVFVVGADSTVAVRPVTVTQQDDTSAVIASGVQADERLVTTGFTRLAAGTRVAVQTSDATPQPNAAPGGPATTPEAPPPEQRRKRSGAENPEGKKHRRRSDNTPDAKQ